tara:strand:+ start:160 stop:828 length:669 start_codon:yes stop_codon:yes gene_type:complete
MTFDYFQLPNPGIARGYIPQNIYDSLMSEIKDIEKNGNIPWNERLVGVIEREYQIVKSRNLLVPFVLKMLEGYLNSLGVDGITSSQEYDKRVSKDWQVSEVWVNLQKKYEYNPIHNHGGEFSFVIWMEIPYSISDERKVKNVIKGRAKEMVSSFQFIYTNILGKIASHCIPVEKGWEGRIIMFPANLNHGVYPFQTSDGYRISISGNLFSPDSEIRDVNFVK